MNTIHIVCASDDGYVSHCGALIVSIFENNKMNSVCVYVLTEYISNPNRSHLISLGKRYGQIVEIVNIPKGSFNDYPMDDSFSGYINKSTYYRLLIPSLFHNLSKVIYLDCDIIVCSDLLSLWMVNIKSWAMAGVKDVISNQINCPRRLGYDSLDSYFNAGVGVWNLDFLRNIRFDDLVKEYILKNYHNIVFHDQDIINGILHGTIFELDIQWNLMTAFLYGENYTKLVNSHKDEMNNPKIIHFADIYKPWFKECINPYKFLYLKYLDLTPWRNERQKYKLIFYQRFVYYIKMYIKKILGKIGYSRYAYFHLENYKE